MNEIEKQINHHINEAIKLANIEIKRTEALNSNDFTHYTIPYTLKMKFLIWMLGDIRDFNWNMPTSYFTISLQKLQIRWTQYLEDIERARKNHLT